MRKLSRYRRVDTRPVLIAAKFGVNVDGVLEAARVPCPAIGCDREVAHTA